MRRLDQLPVFNVSWNHKLIRVFWLILFTFIAFALVGWVIVLLTKPSEWAIELTRYVMLPGAIHLLIMAAGRWVYRRSAPARQDYVMIIWCSAIAAGYLLTIPELYVKYELVCLPLFLSALYFEKQKVTFSYRLNAGIALALFVVNRFRLNSVQPYEAIVSLCVITAALLISHGIVSKGWILLNRLRDAMRREQDLLVQNIIADQMAKVDALTGLRNHRSFQERSEELIRSFEPGMRLALALMDIDNFKSVNDTWGHMVGDHALQAIGDILRDRVDEQVQVFRYGGEEFAALLTGMTPEEAVDWCQDVLDAAQAVIIPEMPGRRISLSAGVAVLQAGMSKDEWFRSADERLYAAKRSGKNAVVGHDDTLHQV
jgi:diguanylate cyclase (GGDEF)-like protein